MYEFVSVMQDCYLSPMFDVDVSFVEARVHDFYTEHDVTKFYQSKDSILITFQSNGNAKSISPLVYNIGRRTHYSNIMFTMYTKYVQYAKLDKCCP